MDRFITLLKAMGTSPRYQFRDAELDQTSLPNWQVALMNDQEILRRELVDLMKGERSIPMAVTGFPVDNQALANTKEIQAGLLEVLTGEVAIKVDTQARDAGQAKPAGGKISMRTRKCLAIFAFSPPPCSNALISAMAHSSD